MAAKAICDDATVRRYLAGKRVYGASIHRIEDALWKLDLRDRAQAQRAENAAKLEQTSEGASDVGE